MSTTSPRPRYTAALYDLPRDLIRELPVELIDGWIRSDQTPQAAAELLARSIVRGTTVVSDASGLTRLSEEKSLIEMLLLINRPKELIHAFGKALGGQAVGIWAADNTQMWYPENVNAADVLRMLLAVRDINVRVCEVWVGLGAHSGEFYNIGGGLYGREAEMIEQAVENHIEGADIIVSRRMAEMLPDGHQFSLEQADDLCAAAGDFLMVSDGPRMAPPPNADFDYPIPYSSELQAALRDYQRKPSEGLLREIEMTFLHERAVVLVERARGEAVSSETGVLDDLALSVLLKKVGTELLGPVGVEVKVAGPLGIYVFEDCQEALAFGRRFREELAKIDVACRVGIDWGPVLVSDVPGGGKDICGMPVNLASKMAQDAGEMNRLYLTKTVAELTGADGLRPLAITVSNVTIEAFEG